MHTASVLANARVYTDPYPFAVCSPALPWELYETLEELRPGASLILDGRKAEDNCRVDLPTIRALGLSMVHEVWHDFMLWHCSRKFVKQVSALLGVEFDRSNSVGPRGGGADIGTECQLGINTPSREGGRVRGPHLDNPIELYGGLLYMNDDDTDFIVYRLVKAPKYYGKLEIEDDCCEEVMRVPCRRNTAVFFANGPLAVHGVSERPPSNKPRLLVNFIAEQKEPLFHVGHGRY